MKLQHLFSSEYNRDNLHVGDEVLVRNFQGRAIIRRIKHRGEVYVYFPDSQRREVVTIDDILPRKAPLPGNIGL